jgi:hypothetical protein
VFWHCCCLCSGTAAVCVLALLLFVFWHRHKDKRFCIYERNLKSDMRCEVRGSLSGVAEDTCLLVCDTVSLDMWIPTFRSFSMSLSSNDSTLDTRLQAPSQHRKPVHGLTFHQT